MYRFSHLVLSCCLTGAVSSAQATQVNKPKSTVSPCQELKTSDKKEVGGVLCAPTMTVVDGSNRLGDNMVELRVVADKNGKVIVATPRLGDVRLFNEAVAAVKRMRFKPKRLGGRRVNTEMVIRYVATPRE